MLLSSWLTVCFEYVFCWQIWLKQASQNLKLYIPELISYAPRLFRNSVQFSCSVVSDSSRPHGPQHARPPCPSPAPGVYSNSSPLSGWCHPTISSSAIPFSCPQFFPASVFSNEPVLCIMWPKYWSFSISLLGHVRLFAAPWTTARWASLSITNSRSPSKLISIGWVILSNYLILCHPLLLSIFPSIRVFSNESALWVRWPKYWSFSFSISPSNEHPGLISLRMDWQSKGLKGLLQHHS